jgi:hypothetical protein
VLLTVLGLSKTNEWSEVRAIIKSSNAKEEIIEAMKTSYLGLQNLSPAAVREA